MGAHPTKPLASKILQVKQVNERMELNLSLVINLLRSTEVPNSLKGPVPGFKSCVADGSTSPTERAQHTKCCFIAGVSGLISPQRFSGGCL